MSDKRPRKAGLAPFSCLMIAALCGSARAQTAPFDALDSIEGDFVNLNAPPVRPMAMTADNLTLFALNTHASRILRFNLATGAATQVMHTAKSPVSIGLWTESGATPGDRLVVVCRDTYALLIHDRATGDVLDLLELRDPTSGRILGEPGDLLIDQAANRAFVSCQAADAVAEIDLTGPSVVHVWRLPCKNPLFMCFDGSPAKNVLVAPLLSGNNSGARRRLVQQPPLPNLINPMHDGPTVVDFETEAQNGTQLPDEDLFRLVRANNTVQALLTDVGTIQFAVGVNPDTSQVWQLNTDANNKNPSKQTEASIKGDIVKNQLTISPLPAVGAPKATAPTPIDLDKVTGGYNPAFSVGQPYALAFGQFGYAVVAGLLTNNVMLLGPTGGFVSEFDLDPDSIPRALLYSPVADRVIVYCWGTNMIDVRQVGLSWTRVHNMSLGLDPTPQKIKTGRNIAYAAVHSAKNNASCLSCHIDGRTDMVVWNLSTPRDDKGPMVTQTLDGIEKTVPFHWRGEQRNNLADFNDAFVNLLGASATLNATEFSNFEAFVLSLQTPPNPFEDETRVVNGALQPVLPPGALVANAVNALPLFTRGAIPGNCESCHNVPIATSNDTVPDGSNFGELNPRRKFIKIAPFNEVYRKDQDADVNTPGMQRRTVDLLALDGSGIEHLEYSLLGTGLTHAGLAPSIFDFVSFFFPGQLQPLCDATAFVRQFDQGIAPAAYRAVLLDKVTFSAKWTEFEDYLVPQAQARNCDIVLFGKFTDNGSLVPMRWWLDRRLAEDDGQFVPEDGGKARNVSFFHDQLEQGEASLVCVGLPVGTGEGFGIDFDRDHWENVRELTLPAPLNPPNNPDPDNRDSDGDGWPDGHELRNPGNPKNASVPSADGTPPQVRRAVTQFVTGKVARINIETNEPCTIQASYSFSGGPAQSASTQLPSLTHSLILNDLRPSLVGSTNTYTGTFIAIDLAGNWSSAQALPGSISTRLMNDVSGVALVGSLAWTTVNTSTPGTLTATATVRVDSKVSGPPEVPLADRRVVARIYKNGVLHSGWTAQGTSSKVATFNVTSNGVSEPFNAFPGPFLVSPLSGGAGPGFGLTTLSFSMTGMNSLDKVEVDFELIGRDFPGDPFLTLEDGSQWNFSSTPAPNRKMTPLIYP